MKSPDSRPENSDIERVNNPNDDGCVLGTAGRDEDPNKAAAWHPEPDAGNKQTPEDAHGMPGYPKTTADDKTRSPATRPPQSSERESGIETPEQGNDKSS